jgi:hypothetical protein
MVETNPAELIAAAEAAAKSARRATSLALLAVLVAVVVLAIDNGIKKSIVAEAQNARRIFDEFRSVVLEASHDAPGGTGETAGTSVPGPSPGSAVDDAPGASAEADPDANGRPPAKGVRRAGQAGGPRGHGSRTGRQDG